MLYAGGMTDLDRLQTAANRGELAASRKRAAREGLSLESALRLVLEASAGAAGLAALLSERTALRRAEAARVLERAAARTAARTMRDARRLGAPTAWRAWFDGSARPNPGRCGIGGLLRGPRDELVELSRAAGYGNSSEAEYLALIAVLEAALVHGAGAGELTGLTVYGDSQVVIDDVNAPFEHSAPVLRPYRARVHALLARLPAATLRWVPRHRNLEADRLSQRAGDLLAIDADALTFL
ncbi:MAG: hypothetical protein JWP72_1543 [Massilia sp.]|jgi:ribonuclease HI|nr:hypothetical protein [Massilia sp.]